LEIIENISLAPFTTFAIGGPARWFAEAASEAEVAEATEWAQGRGVPMFVLGGGSNLLVSDAGFPGMVLHITLKGIEQDHDLFRIAAGESWDDCVERSLAANCAGLECLAGIPGTAGGTPVQNVGAYGQEVASVIERVRALDLRAAKFVEFTAAECAFAYRRSRFNSSDKGQFIVTRIDYRLRPNGSPQIAYQDLNEHFKNFAHAPTLAEVASAVRHIRRRKGMLIVEGDPDCRSAGSFFKNPVVSREAANRATQLAMNAAVPMRMFPADDGRVKIPAAWLIEQAGFRKGYTLGKAAISSRHPLALINVGDPSGPATATDILALAEKIGAAVESKFAIRLEMEPEMVGF
jgi:UDP-N-acetylmuramate dehydrogenase